MIDSNFLNSKINLLKGEVGEGQKEKDKIRNYNT